MKPRSTNPTLSKRYTTGHVAPILPEPGVFRKRPNRTGQLCDERFNGTMRERPATLTRKCRHATHRVYPLETGMYLIGSTYNFCCPHQALRKRNSAGTPGQQKQTPAMASGITDHIWSVLELLRYKVAPPPWVEPKRRGRPRKRPLPDPNAPKRSRGRPRKIR